MDEQGMVFRSTFFCLSCRSSTVPCVKKCGAFARVTRDGSQRKCLLCAGLISKWNCGKEEMDERSLKRWCSFCISEAKHKLVETGLKRDIYECTMCNGRTLQCSKCSTAMTRGGVLWDDELCCICFKPPLATVKTWDDLNLRRETVFLQRNRSRVEAELSRPSQEKEWARLHGVIRPFLLLVAMPAAFRSQISNALGWSIFVEEYFGDPHAEARAILDKTSQGIISRSTKSHERVNPLARNCNWWDILSRSIETSFHDTVSIPDKDYEDMAEQCKGEANDADVRDLEEVWLLHMIEFVQQRMTVEERQSFQDMLDSKEAALVADKCGANAGLTKQGVAEYTYALLSQIGAMPSKFQLSILSLQTISIYVPQTASTLLPVVGSLSVLATPLFFVGLVGFVFSTVDLALGPSIDRIFSPISVILSQRLLLSLEEIDINDYI